MPREAAVGIIGAARGGGGDYRRIAGVIRSRHGGQEHCQHYCKICRRIPNPSRAQPAVTGFRCGMIIARPARVATRRREAGDGFRPALQVTTRDLGADVRSGCTTTAPASRLNCATSCSSRFSRPSRPARAPAGSFDQLGHCHTAASRHDHGGERRRRMHRSHHPAAPGRAGTRSRRGSATMPQPAVGIVTNPAREKSMTRPESGSIIHLKRHVVGGSKSCD